MKNLLSKLFVLMSICLIAVVIYGIVWGDRVPNVDYVPGQDPPPEQVLEVRYWWSTWFRPLSYTATPGTTMEYIFSAELNHELPLKDDGEADVMHVGFEVLDVPPEIRVEWSLYDIVTMTEANQRKSTRLRLHIPIDFRGEATIRFRSFEVAISEPLIITVYEAKDKIKEKEK